MNTKQRAAMEQALEALMLKYSDLIFDQSPDLARQFEDDVRDLRVALAEQPLAQLMRYEPEIWREDRIRMELDSEGDWVRYADVLELIAPQPAIPPGYKLADDERVAALCDLSYAAGMKAGWNFCVNDDDAGFERSQSVTGEAMRVLKKHRTMLAASPAKPAEQMPIAMKTHGAWDGLELLDGLPDGTCLYTAPQATKRVPLTREELADAWLSVERITNATERQIAFASAVIAAYEAKNGITGEQS